MLAKRPMTAARKLLGMLLAALVAHEWDSQEKLIKTHALPLVRPASRCAIVA